MFCKVHLPLLKESLLECSLFPTCGIRADMASSVHSHSIKLPGYPPFSSTPHLLVTALLLVSRALKEVCSIVTRAYYTGDRIIGNRNPETWNDIRLYKVIGYQQDDRKI